MTEPKSRGVWGDPHGARMVLDALGGPARPDGPVRSREGPREPLRGPYRGRCGNGAHPAVYVGKGASRALLEPASDGCELEASVDSPHLKLCDQCLAKYKGAAPQYREHVAALGARSPMPGLCYHGQKPHQCEANCKEFNK